MDKKHRINEAFIYLKSRGIVHTQKDIALAMGASASNVSSALKGVDNVLTDSFLSRFNKAFNSTFSEHWLLTGEGEMLSTPSSSTPNYESVKDRILQYILYKGITKKAFELNSGLSNGYLNSLREKPSEAKLQSIYKAFPDINPVWLLSGVGGMFIEDIDKNSIAAIQTNGSLNLSSSTPKAEAPEPSPDFSPQNLVPLVPIAAQGGSLSEFADSAMAYDCEKVISPIKDVDMAICVSGDSMAPEYPPGCQILVKKINERAFIDWGRVYVLDTVNGAVIKKVLPADSPDTVLCVSINPDYPPFEVRMEHINGFYRVMMMMSLK